MTDTFTTSDHDDVHDLAALYAIDALDAAEAEEFARHLPGCTRCQQEVAELRTAGAALALAVATPLPPGLRQRVMDDIARQPQIPAPPAAGSTSAPAAADPAAVVPLDAARRRPRSLRPRLLAAVAAAVVVLAGAVGALAVVRGGGSGGDDRTAAEAAFAAVQAAPDARTLVLAGGEPGTAVQVAWSAVQDRAVLLADGVPDPGAGRTYELWRIDAGGPDPAGLFDPDGSGAAGLVVPLDGGEPSAWGVTVEPDGGSPAPTPPIVYQAEA